MLSGIKNIKKAIFLISLATIGGCASTVEENNYQESEKKAAIETYRPIHKQLTETKILGSDEINAAYEDKREAAPVIPVIRQNQTDMQKLDKEKEFNKILMGEKEKKIEKQISQKQTNIPNVPPPINKTEPSIAYQAATIFFADGSTVVASKYYPELSKIAQMAKEKNAHITVYGFSSSRTKDMDIAKHKMVNFKISLKRAENVVAALVKAGVDKNSIKLEALSDTMPLYSEAMPAGERMNRRAEIYVSY